jgi:predicted ribosome quality control (RQC) complex YloA/Tae2 family protein
MEVVIDLRKNIEKNAEFYYEKAKKAKRKIKGAEETYKKFLKQLNDLKEKSEVFVEKEREKRKPKRKREWYEKFRWFFSSEGFLCIGGRDSTTNDIIIKKYLDKGDIVFHTESPGSPFFVVKAGGKDIGEDTINEVAEATASYSRAWKVGHTSAEVYYVKHDQVKKELGLPKGTFMIYGKRNYLTPVLKIAVGIKDRRVIGGAVGAVKKNSEKFLVIVPGSLKKSDIAKKIRAKIGGGLDEIQGFLPAGGGKIVKWL